MPAAGPEDGAKILATGEGPVPAGQALQGLTMGALPERWTPLEALVVVKCRAEHGSPKWAMRFTDGINEEELLGALVLHTDLLKQDMLNDWVNED
jgi:hypothetical protein